MQCSLSSNVSDHDCDSNPENRTFSCHCLLEKKKKEIKRLLVGGKKNNPANYPSPDSFLNPAHLSYFFSPYSESKMNTASNQSTNGLFPPTLHPPPQPQRKGLERLQDPLRAITSQGRRWQLRQGLMQSDIIECGPEQGSCLQPLLIVAVIR